ncbi:MAG TPA: hypothetical protein VG826_05720 [Pirellulales bacterium]|nr:hypothetical protein [Pirellulales bacterium]
MAQPPLQFSLTAVFAVMTVVALAASGWLPWIWLATAVIFQVVVFGFLAIWAFQGISDFIRGTRPPE